MPRRSTVGKIGRGIWRATLPAASTFLLVSCVSIGAAGEGGPDVAPSPPVAVSATASPTATTVDSADNSSAGGFDAAGFWTGLLTGTVTASIITAIATSKRERKKHDADVREARVGGAKSALSDLRTALLSLVQARTGQVEYDPGAIADQTTRVLVCHSEVRVQVKEAAQVLKRADSLKPLMAAVTEAVTAVLSRAGKDGVLSELAPAYANANKAIEALTVGLSDLETPRRGGR